MTVQVSRWRKGRVGFLWTALHNIRTALDPTGQEVLAWRVDHRKGMERGGGPHRD